MRLENKKDKLWLSADPSKWELSSSLKVKPTELLQNKIEAYKQMCYKENLIEWDLKQIFGYFNAQAMKEVNKGVELKALAYRKMLDGLSKETQIIYEDMLKDWRSNADFCFQDLDGRPSLLKGNSKILERFVQQKATKDEKIEKINEKIDKLDSDSD